MQSDNIKNPSVRFYGTEGFSYMVYDNLKLKA